MRNTYAGFYPFKALFDGDYDQMYVDLYSDGRGFFLAASVGG